MIILNVDVEIYNLQNTVIKPRYKLLSKNFDSWSDLIDYCKLCFYEWFDKLPATPKFPIQFEKITPYYLIIPNSKIKWFVKIEEI